ncbi:MAG: NAD-dependent epimerase/dehydratase family protein [Desulfovibrionales bacterium]
MNSAREVIRADLNYITASLQEEFQAMQGRRLLITGGAGFLGYYLVQSVLEWNRFAERDQRIKLSVYDNYSRGVPDWLTRLNGNSSLSMVRHDITHPLPSDMPDFDYIIHAASIASPTFYRMHPIETMDANVTGLRSLLEYCRNQKENGKPVSGFLFYSTSEIYGDPPPEQIPTSEEFRGNVSCIGPRSCYDESKRYGETLCVNFARVYGLPVTIARPFNNYGPGLKITDKRVLPDFARAVLSGEDIVMLSDGSPTRTFCYSADGIIGYYKILVRGRPGEAYNIGVDGPEISVGQLAERVTALASDLFGYKGRVIKHSSPDKDYLVDNPNRRCPVIDKARSHLGYDPGIPLDIGLRRSLLWYRDNQSAEES